MPIEVISPQRHKGASVRPSPNHTHVANLSVAPLVSSEIGRVATYFPIAFGRLKADAPPVPCAVFSFEVSDNLFVHPQTGAWRGGYLPALIRRHPFLLVAAGNDDKGQPQLALGIDTDSGLLDENGVNGERLFDEEGNQSAYLKQTLEFMLRVQGESRQMEKAGQVLLDAGVLVPFETAVPETVPLDDHKRIKGLMRVDEVKLNALDDETFLSLRKGGVLAIAYVHLASMAMWERLSALYQLTKKERIDAPAAPLPGVEPEDDWVISFD